MNPQEQIIAEVHSQRILLKMLPLLDELSQFASEGVFEFPNGTMTVKFHKQNIS